MDHVISAVICCCLHGNTQHIHTITHYTIDILIYNTYTCIHTIDCQLCQTLKSQYRCCGTYEGLITGYNYIGTLRWIRYCLLHIFVFPTRPLSTCSNMDLLYIGGLLSESTLSDWYVQGTIILGVAASKHRGEDNKQRNKHKRGKYKCHLTL